MSFFDGRLIIEVAAASGIEAVVKRELRALGYEPAGAVNGRICFDGDFSDVLRANMFLRAAERVRVVIARFKAETFDMLYDGVRGIRFSDILPKEGRIVVNAKSKGSKLFALSAIQSVVKKAIVDSTREAYGLSSLPECGEEYSFEASLVDDDLTLALDCSGDALHKRGYRTYLGAAPIRETLASAMLLLSVWKGERPFADPFCGSGTIAIEAALIGLNIASGKNRKFACEDFSLAPKLGARVRQEALDLETPNAKVDIYGCDIDPEAIKLATLHSRRAGVDKKIRLEQADMRDFSPKRSYGVIVTNPPYGERLMDEKQLRALYADFGRMCAALDNWSVYAISAYKGFEKCFGRRADKTRKMYNSELECNFFRYLAEKPKREEDI